MTDSPYKPIVHRLALLTAIVTWPLIFMGGLVTSKQAGLSVPDWPNSFGYNMWAFPPSQWWNGGGIFYEHSHRLMATVVGWCAILYAAAAWKWEPRPWARKLAYGVLGFVIFQGILGGLRVVLVNLDLAMLHAVTAQLFFCTAALAAIVTSRWWIDAPDLSSDSSRRGRSLKIAAGAAFIVVFGQLVIGAIMRHLQAGLAIPDVPLAYGHWLPPMSADALRQDNHTRAFSLDLDPVTMTQVWLAFAHRVGAIVVSLAVLHLGTAAILRQTGRLRWLGASAIALLLLQVTLGVWTVLARKPADVASAHVAIGALLMVTVFATFVSALRLFRSPAMHIEPQQVRLQPVARLEPIHA